MSETPTLSLGDGDPERPIVDVYGKSFRLRAVTRSVQKNLQKVDIALNRFMTDGTDTEDDGDIIVGLLADGLSALLEIEGQHRTPVKKLIHDKWQADELALHSLRRFFESLQEQAVARPT